MKHEQESFITKLKNGFITVFLAGIMLLCLQGYTTASSLKFAQISDVHFLNHGENTTYKVIAEGPNLLDDAVSQVNIYPNLDFVMITGDLIDKYYEIELKAVLPHLEKINKPWYFAFGNHDVCVGGYLTKSLYMSILREHNPAYTFTKPYYSFVPKNGYKVIVLDSIIDTEVTAHGYIYPEQLKWLDEELNASKKDTVLIFMHVPLVEPFPSANHNMKNAAEVISVIEKYKNPIGVFSGHYHATKITQHGNVLYVSTPALITYPNAFRIVTVTNRKNHVVFEIQFKETRLKNVQKFAKLLVFASALYAGEEKDRNGIFIIKK